MVWVVMVGKPCRFAFVGLALGGEVEIGHGVVE